MTSGESNRRESPRNETRPPQAAGRSVLSLGERLLAFGLAVLLLRSAFSHLGNPYYFLSTVYAYQLTGVELGQWVAFALPYLQMVVGLCLLSRWWVVEAYLLSLAMFLVFFSAQVLALRQDLQISCGCFGASANMQVGSHTLAFAGAAATASLVGVAITAAAGGVRVGRGAT